MSRRRKALYLFIGLTVVLALLAAKMIAQVRRGEELFWLAELWAPAACLSIGLVTGIEFLMPPSPSRPAGKMAGASGQAQAAAQKSSKKRPLPRSKPKKA